MFPHSSTERPTTGSPVLLHSGIVVPSVQFICMPPSSSIKCQRYQFPNSCRQNSQSQPCIEYHATNIRIRSLRMQHKVRRCVFHAKHFHSLSGHHWRKCQHDSSKSRAHILQMPYKVPGGKIFRARRVVTHNTEASLAEVSA